MAHTKISDLKGIYLKDNKGIISKLLDSEFKSGVFLERKKLISEFLKDLEILDNADIDLWHIPYNRIFEKWENLKKAL